MGRYRKWRRCLNCLQESTVCTALWIRSARFDILLKRLEMVDVMLLIVVASEEEAVLGVLVVVVSVRAVTWSCKMVMAFVRSRMAAMRSCVVLRFVVMV